jgi:hypothetical protein
MIAASLCIAATAGAIPTEAASSIDNIDTLVADNPRKDRRDNRQEKRPDRREDRQDCRDDEGRVGHDKRDCKQENRGEDGAESDDEDKGA